jgi:hypothetical protein
MDSLLELTIAWSLATLFAASALHKVLALSEWPGVVRHYRLVPDALTEVVAGALLGAQTLTAAALFFAPTRRIGAVSAAIQLTVFGAALWINIGRGRTSVDCGCFGSQLRSRLSMWMVVRNGVIAIVALSLLLPRAQRELSPAEMMVSVVLVVTLALLYPVVAVVFEPPPPTYNENYLNIAGTRSTP